MEEKNFAVGEWVANKESDGTAGKHMGKVLCWHGDDPDARVYVVEVARGKGSDESLVFRALWKDLVRLPMGGGKEGGAEGLSG